MRFLLFIHTCSIQICFKVFQHKLKFFILMVTGTRMIETQSLKMHLLTNKKTIINIKNYVVKEMYLVI